MNSDIRSPRTPALTSRLPEVGTTIFSVMSALAQKHGAVNLGQGFPDFDCDPGLVDDLVFEGFDIRIAAHAQHQAALRIEELDYFHPVAGRQ